MSLRGSPWWPAFVAALRDQPLERLAGQLGLGREELATALLAADDGGRAEDAPWWPEAVRSRGEGLSLRALARCYHCEPRRLRRALARTGQRVGGAELEGKGVPALVEFRPALGQKPDGEIARAAKVSPEAVKGERARLGVAAFRPRPSAPPALSDEDEAWIQGPVKEKRPRSRPDSEGVQVVHRPRSNPPPDSPASFAPRGRTLPPPPTVEVRGRSMPPPGEGRGRTPPSVPVVEVRGRSIAPPEPRPRSMAPEEARRPAPSQPVVDARPRSIAPGDLPRWGPDRPDRQEELDRLLQPTSRSREGRMRLVRKEDAPRSVADEPRPQVDLPPMLRRSVAQPERPVAAPMPLPLPAPAAAPLPAQHAWFVWIPGEESPLVVHAPDIARAIDAAASRLPWEVLQRAQFARADRKPT